MKQILAILLITLVSFGCVITYRAKKQKTTESEYQIGIAGPDNEYSQSQIDAEHLHKDTIVEIRVKKDTIIKSHDREN